MATRPRAGLARSTIVAWATLSIVVPAVCRGQSADESVRPPLLRRVVHHFDFDELESGNYESVPMHWTRVLGDRFPGFAVGAFDADVGRTAPPSFRLGSDGRNVGLWYHGPATEVRPNSEYLIVGWIRPDRLTHARASLSAYFLDHQGLPIEGTQVFGRLVGGDPRDGVGGGWQPVRIHLPTGPPEARTIGLTVWVVQRDAWDHSPRPHRHIEPQDIDAGAWFDDITIYRMPRAVLATADAPGNIFVEPAPAVLEAIVADSDAVGLRATLTVRSAAGRLIYQTEIPITTTRPTLPTAVKLADLTPGLYQATLDIRTEHETAVTRHLRFAYLGAEHNRGTGVARPFGVVLDPVNRADAETEFALLSALSVGAVKYPVWSPTRSDTPENGGPGSDRLLHDLIKTRIALTGVLGSPPAGLVQSAGQYARTLLAILSDDPQGWRSHLAAVTAPYASVFRTWQIGADGDRTISDDARLPDVLGRVRREMMPLITTVTLGVPGDITDFAGRQPLPVEEVTVRIGLDVHADWIDSYLSGHRSLNYDRVSAYVDIERSQAYARIPRLGQFARRIIRTRHAGVDTTYVPQLWHTRQTVNGPVTEPTDIFVVYRTIVDVLRDLTPGPTVKLADGVVALAFHDAESSVLAMWDPSAPPEGRIYEFQIGSAPRQIDLWGRATPLAEGADGRRQVRLYAQPVFIDQVGRWLVDFIASVELLPAKVEHSLLPQTHALRLENAGKKQLAGRVELKVPPGWEVRPRRFSFRLAPHAQFDQSIELQHGQNEPAGTKQIIAVIDFDSDPPSRVEVPLTLELGIRDLDVWGFVFLEGDHLVLRHGVTNRSAEPLSLRSFATAPGRSRQFRVIPSLAPGESTTAEYHFKDAEVLAGRTVRLGLREVDGPRSHTIELIAP